MIKFDLKQFKDGKLVVWCDTSKKFYEFLHKLIDIGVMQTDDVDFMSWNDEKEDTCVLYDGEVLYGNRLRYECKNDTEVVDYCILSFEDNGTFKLKEGMIIEIDDKQDPFWYIRKVKGELIATNDKEWFYLKCYNDKLMNEMIPSLNIVKVYESNSYTLNNLFSKENLVLIWERKEKVEEMTLEEICKALGKKIKIKED